MNNLGHLPGELILSILDHVDETQLYACTLINKAFYKEANPVLWRRLDIGDSDTLSTLTTIMATTTPSSSSSPGEHVRHLKIRSSSLLTDSSLLALIQHVPLLETLELARFQEHVTDASLQHVPRSCPHLTYFIIECRYETSTHIGPTSPRTMTALAAHCPQLRYVKLESCRELDSGLFSALSSGGCPLIEVLIIDSCDLRDMKDDPKKVDTAAMHLTDLTCLKELKIWYHSFDHTVFMTTAMAGAWPHLTYLSLYICPSLDDQKAIAFIQAHPHLEHLELRDTIITDATLDAIIAYLPDITVVVLDWSTGITAAGLRRLVQTTAKLHHVEFFGCGLFLHDFVIPSTHHRHLIKTMDDLNHEIRSQEELDEDENEAVRLYKGAFDDIH